jgi:hypothetical protein
MSSDADNAGGNDAIADRDALINVVASMCGGRERIVLLDLRGFVSEFYSLTKMQSARKNFPLDVAIIATRLETKD